MKFNKINFEWHPSAQVHFGNACHWYMVQMDEMSQFNRTPTGVEIDVFPQLSHIQKIQIMFCCQNEFALKCIL